MTIVRTATDAWTAEGAPAHNYGEAAQLWLNGGTGGNDKRAYIYFKPPFPPGATVFSAKLRVWAKGAWAGTQTLTAKRITQKWSEAQINWNTAPTVTATNSAALVVASGVDGQLLELDVSAMMADVSGGSGFFGFRLELSTDVDRAVHSSEAVDASLRPQLEIVWSSPPETPTGLAPSGGNIISVTKPVLSWIYKDPGGETGQSSSQVQISTSSSFASPEYDSGKVANTLQQWDLAATAYAGVGAGATKFWRVRVWDETDLPSPYSDPVSFTRTAKGTLTLTNPAGSTIDDLTFKFTWSLAGATQEAYRLILHNVTMHPALDPGGTVVQDSGKITSSAQALAVIPGRLNDHDSFQVVIRVWDTADRQGIPGDPAYYEVVSSVFTYSRSGVPAAVTALTATVVPTTDGPGVQLDFTRSAAPTWFALKVDGRVVVPRIDPASVFVSGTSYRYTYWGAVPRVAHTFEVEAVVAAGGSGALQHSAGNATASKTTTPTGVWLMDPTDNTAIRFAGTDDPSMAIGESGATFIIAGARAPIRITDQVRGQEGSWAGMLRTKTDRDNFLKLKGRLAPLRLLMGDLNMPIILEEISAAPTALPGDKLFRAGFAFRQTDEFTFDVVGG